MEIFCVIRVTLTNLKNKIQGDDLSSKNSGCELMAM